MQVNIEPLVADLTAKMETARRSGQEGQARALEECSRELQAAVQAYNAALQAANDLLDRSANVTKAVGRRVEGPRADALVHTQQNVAPAFTRLTAAMTRCAALLRDSP